MINFLDKFFKRTNNLDYISTNIINLTKDTPVKKIFESINSFSPSSEVRYVGGCIRKIIKKEKVDEIDLATNLNPEETCDALNKFNINYYKTGFEHGTITAIIDDFKFEITSLREDIKTDGRHAEVKFSKDWKKDASRRDFSINSIYSDAEGNLFDPFNGKKDLENGLIKFIGEPEVRIREDYLRILRYLRFYLNYSNFKHDPKTIKAIKKNLGGISNLSKERLFDELKKYIKSNIFTKLAKDKFANELFKIIFPQIKRIKYFSNPNMFAKMKLLEADFIFLLSILIIDGSDNADFFMYKFNFSKKEKKRLKIIDEFFKDKITTKSFTENRLNRIFYFSGKQAVLDVIGYKLFSSNKVDKDLMNLLDKFKNKDFPTMPVGAKILIDKYGISEGKNLGKKLKIIEEEWVNNNFQISENRIEKIINL